MSHPRTRQRKPLPRTRGTTAIPRWRGALWLMLLAPGLCLAALDPTRPPARLVPATAATSVSGSNGHVEAPPAPTLRYIRYSAEQRAVMLDDELLAEGESAHGITVRRILPDAVVVVQNGKEKILKMFAADTASNEIKHAKQD